MSKSISCLQITDFHLFEDPKKTLLGTNTDDSLSRVLAHVKAKGHEPDFIAITGDISQDFSVRAYERMLELFQDFTCPIYSIPGNHDSIPNMMKILAPSYIQHERYIDLPNWVIIFLNTHVPGKVYGHLDDTELLFLTSHLKEAKNKNVLIFLHHHCVDIGEGWLNPLGVQNAEKFHAIIHGLKNIKAVVCGHIHQEFHVQKDGVWFLGTPSTCIQFKPKMKRFTLDERNPGYREFTLLEDGQILTTVHRIENYTHTYDPNAAGY